MECLLNRAPGDRTGHANATFVPCYRWQCKHCGWNAEEHARRIKRGLVTGPDGLRYIPIKRKQEGW